MSCSVSLKNITAKIGERTLFENLNFSIGHKEKIAIIGANGVGKTTLLEIIAGLNANFDGDIELFHENVNDPKIYSRYRHLVGFLFQNSDEQFICPGVFDDVAFGLLASGVSQSEAKKRAEFMLNELEISHLKDKIVYNLSGGEKKLVALAGVLVMEPKILLFDEPTGGLDENMQKRLTKILQKLEKSIIIVSHDRAFLECVVTKFYTLTPNGLIS